MGLLALAAYAALAPAIPADKDSGEFTLVLATLGLAHPTGYPLYTLLGSAFVHVLHATGVSWARAANLFSAVGGATAIALLHALGVRMCTGRVSMRTATWLALLPAVAFGANPVWTAEATLAEVNAWHVAWALSAALATLEIVTAPASAARAPNRGAFAWGLVMGAGLAHHATSVLVGAPLALAVALSARHRPARGRLALAAIGGATLPLLSLAFVAWRAWHPAAVQWPEMTQDPMAVVRHLTGAQYSTFFGHFSPSAGQRVLLQLHVFPWLALAAAGALAACFAGDRRDRTVRVAIAFSFAIAGAWGFLYGVPDPSYYFLAPLALGLALVPSAVAPLARARVLARGLTFVAAFGVIAYALWGGRLALERGASWIRVDRMLRAMWDSVPQGPSFLVWDDDMISRLRLLQWMDHEHPECELVQPSHLTHPAPRRRFIEAHGFDPIAGLEEIVRSAGAGDELATQRVVEAIASNIDRHTPVPTYLFLPQVPSVRQLRKSASPVP